MSQPVITPRARTLGAELRYARNEAGLSSREMGEALGVPHNRVLDWEKGYPLPNEDKLSRFLQVCQINGERAEEIMALRRAASERNYLTSGMDRHLAVLAEYERTATEMYAVATGLIPGLLQTSDYMRALFTGSAGEDNAAPGEVEKRVMVRLARQDVLSRPGPVRFAAFLAWGVVTDMPCSDEVAAGQLRHLHNMMQRDNIEVRVVPLGVREYTSNRDNSFTLMQFEKADPLIHTDVLERAALVTEPRAVEYARRALDNLSKAAMSPAATAELIAKLITEKERSK